jgi:probable selenium-dependent hydroxylase accessory protein YqeC
MDTQSLCTALDIGEGDLVALIGGGGKTTCLLALAGELRAHRHRTLIMTTTKIWPPAGIPLVLCQDRVDPLTYIDEILAAEGIAVLGQCVDDEGKLRGVPPEEVCAASSRAPQRAVLCEADGAAGKPLKVHGPHEPVVPQCANQVLIVAGMDAVGESVRESVHRAEDFAASRGVPITQRLLPQDVAETLLATAVHAPAGARVGFILSKCDTEARLVAAHQVASLLKEGCLQAQVVGVSFGELTLQFASLYSS